MRANVASSSAVTRLRPSLAGEELAQPLRDLLQRERALPVLRYEDRVELELAAQLLLDHHGGLDSAQGVETVEAADRLRLGTEVAPLAGADLLDFVQHVEDHGSNFVLGHALPLVRYSY